MVSPESVWPQKRCLRRERCLFCGVWPRPLLPRRVTDCSTAERALAAWITARGPKEKGKLPERERLVLSNYLSFKKKCLSVDSRMLNHIFPLVNLVSQGYIDYQVLFFLLIKIPRVFYFLTLL